MTFRDGLLFKPLVAVAGVVSLVSAGLWVADGGTLLGEDDPPPAHCPGDLRAYQRPDGSVLVMWEMRDVSTRYVVERSEQGGPFGPIVAGWGGDNFDDRTARSGRAYEYVVSEDGATRPHGCPRFAAEPMPEAT